MNSERSLATPSAIDGALAPLSFSEITQTRADTCLASTANNRVDLSTRPPAPILHAVKNSLHQARQPHFIVFCVSGTGEELWRDLCPSFPPRRICVVPIAVGKIKNA